MTNPLRTALIVGLLMSVVPSTGALLFVRPAPAAAAATSAPVYSQVGLTALLAGVRTAGLVGVSGGLVTLDSGSASVVARLDAAPSAQVLAAPYEPGTLARTGAGQVNAAAGQAVIDVPDAEARYPGQSTGQLETVPPQTIGPVSLAGGSASALTTATRASGTATGAAFVVAGALRVGLSSSTVEMTAVAATGTVRQTGHTEVSRVEVGGLLIVEDIVGRATLTATRDVHTADQSLAIGGASVGGQEVVIGNDGVRAVGMPLVPGQDLKTATDQVNARLLAAGIAVRTVGGRSAHSARGASADTGGVQITLATSDLPGGVAANHLTITVGGVSLTELDALTVPELATPPVVDLGPAPVLPGTTTTTFVPGTSAVPALPPLSASEQPPQVAPTSLPAAFLVSGRRVSAQTALLAFAGWQFLSLGTATLYAFVERRRRVLQLGRLA